MVQLCTDHKYILVNLYICSAGDINLSVVVVQYNLLTTSVLTFQVHSIYEQGQEVLGCFFTTKRV